MPDERTAREILRDSAQSIALGRAAAATVKVEDVRLALREHCLTGIECDHEAKRDRPMCRCSLIDLGWHPSVGEAVEAWIDHVLASIALSDHHATRDERAAALREGAKNVEALRAGGHDDLADDLQRLLDRAAPIVPRDPENGDWTPVPADQASPRSSEPRASEDRL